MTATAEANEALVRRFYEEVWNRGNLDVADEVFAADYVRHDLRAGDAAPGPQGQKDIAAAFRRAFPDLDFAVEFTFGDGEYVAGRWTATGTHTGDWADVPPTGRGMRFSGVNLFRFGDDGKVVELWNHRDDLGLLQQLGSKIYAGAPPS
jgi:steroid delta-isomerase-like uncharacterized protein